MARIPLIDDVVMTPDQQRVYDLIVTGPRGEVVGPLRAALHAPQLAESWSALGETLRYHTSLPHALKELAIAVSGRHWNAGVEWFIHADVAARAGIAPAALEAIRTCQPPQFDDVDEWLIYEYARLLLRYGRVSDDLYDQALDRFGTVALVELTALLGYYSMVALTLNAHRVPVPDRPGSRLPPTPPEGEDLQPMPLLSPAQPVMGEVPTR